MNDILVLALVTTIVFLLLSVFIVSFFLIFQKRRMEHFQEKNLLHVQYSQNLMQAQIEVQNSTLQQISQELHDNIGQLLSVARINLNILEELDHSPETSAYIQQTNEIIDRSIHDLRSLTKSLDGDFVKDFGLEQSLSHELARIKKTSKFDTEINIHGTRKDLGYEREIVLFRICQEVLNNILKHSQARQIFASLDFTTEMFKLSIGDDGVGFVLNDPNMLYDSGAGIRNMTRRTQLIGGSIHIDTAPGEGTRITIELDLTTSSNEN